MAGVDGCWPRFSERLYPKGVKYQQLRSSRSSSGVYVCVGLEKRSHRCLMHTCDLRETGSSGYKGVKDKQARHPRTDITAGGQSKGQKEEKVSPKASDGLPREAGTLSCGLVCHS